AERQRVLLKDQADGLEIELGRQVEHRKILVIEGLRRLRLLPLTVREVLVELSMGLHVTFDVHAHEGGKLYEAGIDATKGAAVAERDGRDQILLEPGHRL